MDQAMQSQSQLQIGQPQQVVAEVKVETRFSKFDEYRLFIEDTARLSDRRQTVTNAYITVNGAIVALITFVFRDAGVKDWRAVVALLPLILAGLIVCYFWHALLYSYKELLRFRFKQLEKMEEELPGSHKMYTLESVGPYNRTGAGATIPQEEETKTAPGGTQQEEEVAIFPRIAKRLLWLPAGVSKARLKLFGKRRVGQGRVERMLPGLFAVLYVVIFVITVIFFR